MKSLVESVEYFMENYGVYDNPQAVEIVHNSDNSIAVAADWPGEKNEDGFNIEIFVECKTITEFILVFDIRCVEDLSHIIPAFLLTLYEQGRAEICCAVDNYPNYYPMQYRKINDNMLATNDHDIEHEVKVLLKTPQQFRDYTEQCYQLIKA